MIIKIIIVIIECQISLPVRLPHGSDEVLVQFVKPEQMMTIISMMLMMMIIMMRKTMMTQMVTMLTTMAVKRINHLLILWTICLRSR